MPPPLCDCCCCCCVQRSVQGPEDEPVWQQVPRAVQLLHNLAVEVPDAQEDAAALGE